MTPAAEGIAAARRDDLFRDTSTETLRLWLENNRKLIGEFDPHIERTQLERCQQHIRNIRAELAFRKKGRADELSEVRTVAETLAGDIKAELARRAEK